MTFPPPPGLNQPSSLPARPPPSASAASPSPAAYSAAPSYSSPGTATSGYAYGGNGPSRPPGAFTAFAPRSVASSQQQPYRTNSPVVSAPPATTAAPTYSAPPTAGYGSYYSQPPQTYQGGAQYYGAAQYNDPSAYGPTVPHIQNPFSSETSNAYGARGKGYGRNDSGLDADTEAQIAQWQSAYANRDEEQAAGKVPGRPGMSGSGAGAGAGGAAPSAAPTVGTPAPGPEPAPKTVVRAGGGQKWTDSTLLEWDPAHFRLFVGNLAGEVTDDSLLKAFAKYTSVQKARVIRDKRTQKSKGYGFVSFSDGDDYFKAAREMQGKYIGSHPVLLRRAMTEVKPVDTRNVNKKNGGGGSRNGHGGGKVKQDGVKKPGKTKGGLKILG